MTVSIGSIVGGIIFLFSLPWLLGTVLPWIVGIFNSSGPSNVVKSSEVIAGAVTPGWIDPVIAFASVSGLLGAIFLFAVIFAGRLDS